MWNFVFESPRLLYLLAILPLLIIFYILRQSERTPGVRISALSFFSTPVVPFRLVLKHILFGLQMIAIASLIVAFARPQSTESWSETRTEGIDITMCLDVSGSMRAMDFNPNRLEAAKDVAAEFVNGRPNDRFAIVAFSAESFTLCPLTSDRAEVVRQIDNLNFGMLQDGTAIGLGLATSVNRLKDSQAKSKVIILLTDGVNNAGSVGPVTAAEIAVEYGIRVYTIGVGTEGTAPIPVNTIFGQQIQQMKVEIDEDVLQKVAEMTGAKYFRATDKQKLEDIYTEIDKMEKTILDTQNYSKRQEEYFPFLLAGVVLLAFESLIRLTVIRSIP